MAAMNSGRCKRRKTTGGDVADGGSSASKEPKSPSRPSSYGLSPASLAVAVDLYAQARKALTERCPFDGYEAATRPGTLPSALASNLQKKSDGHRKHSKVHEDAAGKDVKPARPPVAFSVWEETEEYFKPITHDDIDLMVPRLPPDSCFYFPRSENVPDEVEKDEAVPDESPKGQMDPSSSSVVVEEEWENVELEAVQAMQTGIDLTCTTVLPVEDAEVEDRRSLNWILGCKQKFLLTSERSLEKRRLPGEDAGLEQLLLLPCTQEGAESPLCDICCLGESHTKLNQLLFCNSCKILVHQKCYGVHLVPAGAWLCSWCKHPEAVGREAQRKLDGKDSSLWPCLLCSTADGALKPVARNLEGSEDTKFAHLFCSLWTPGVYVEDIGVMEPVKVDGLLETRRRLVCNLCKVKHGVCVRCSHGKCRTSLHPLCARAAKHQMEIRGKFGHDNVELRVFCSKHSSIQNIDKIPNAEHPSRITDIDFLVCKLLPASVPIKRLPKIRITCQSKNKIVVLDGIANSASDELAKKDTNLYQLKPESGDAQSNQMADVVPDDGNVLPNASDLIKIFRKIIDRRKINIGDVALELGVSSTSLESSMKGDGTFFPSELRLKVIQWLQNFAHVQPSTRHLKIRNGSLISSGSLIPKLDGQKTVCLQGKKTRGSIKLQAVNNHPLAKSELPCRIKNNKHNSADVSMLSSRGDVFLQANCEEFVDVVGGVWSNHTKDMVTDANGCVFPHSIEDCHLQEHDVPEMAVGNVSGLPHSDVFGKLPFEGKSEETVVTPDKLEGSDLKEVSDCSHIVEIAQIFEPDIAVLKSDRLVHPDYDAGVALNPNLKDVGSCSRSFIHSFILTKLIELQNQWNLLHKHRNIESTCSGYGDNRIRPMDMNTYANELSTIDTLPSVETIKDQVSNNAKLSQLANAKNMKILELSPETEVEGELLYLQNWLLDRANSINYSCEKLIYRIIQHLPQELDVFRKKRWDMVLVNQYLREVKEAKKWRRKERRHKEAQAILAAATAAAATSRNSLLRKDTNDGISLSHQQNLLKISIASGRATLHSPPGPRLKETHPRSFIVKISSDKHSGKFKFPDVAKEDALFCDVCWRTETIVNRIFVCSNCKVAVHLDCYRKVKAPNGPWRCELCEDTSSQCISPGIEQLDCSKNSYSRVQCYLCGGSTGAFRKTLYGEWIHAFCAEWLLESAYKRGQRNLVEGMDAILKGKDYKTCCICHYRLGLCLMCSYGHCQTTFHPTCARSTGFFMNIKAMSGRFQRKAYCEKHSVDQREKADIHHGAEELKSIKKVRIELERIRLLCERIIRREKLKREMVICSHGILTSRMDCVAFSSLVCSSFSPGISSESATTSVGDHQSYSGTIRRPNDITVDSSVAERPSASGWHPFDVHRKTNDRPVSQLSIKRKVADRTTLSSKQLPQRPTTAAFFNVADDGERIPKLGRA